VVLYTTLVHATDDDDDKQMCTTYIGQKCKLNRPVLLQSGLLCDCQYIDHMQHVHNADMPAGHNDIATLTALQISVHNHSG